MGRPKGAKNKADEAKAFVGYVERALKAGKYPDGLINIVCRQLNNPDLCNPILVKLLEYKYSRIRESGDEHKHLHLEMTPRDADALIRGYFSAPGTATDKVGQSYQGKAAEQDIELLPG